MSEGIGEDHFNEAIDRLARTPDGEILYLFLQRRLMAVPTSTEDGALRSDHGERSFAARLISLMAKGIQERGGRTGSTSDTSSGSTRPIVFAVASPRPTGGGPRGSGRRGPSGPVAGWDSSVDPRGS